MHLVLWLVAFLFLVSAATSPRLALWLVVAAASIYDDRQLVDTFLEAGKEQVPTIFNLKIAGFQIIDWFLLVLIGLALWKTWSRRRSKRPLWDGWRGSRIIACLALATVPYIYSSITGLLLGNSLKLLLQDLQNHAYLLGMAAATAAIVESERDTADTVWVLLAALSAKSLVLFGRFLLGIGYRWVSVFRVTLSSDSIVLMVLVAGLAYLAIQQKRRPMAAMPLFILLILTGFILFNIASRTGLVLAATQFALLLLYLPGRGKLAVVAASAFLIAAGAAYLMIDQPHLADFYWWRLTSIFVWKPNLVGGDGVLLSNSVKVLEIRNVLDILARQGALLTGLGQGATWSASIHRIPLPYFNDGYPPGEVQHASTHLQVLSHILKAGIFGAAIYWLGVTGAVWRVVKMSLCRHGHALAVIALGLIPLTYNMANFERIYLFSGLLLGLALRWEMNNPNSHEPGGSFPARQR